MPRQFEEVEPERVLIEQQVHGDAEYRSGVARVDTNHGGTKLFELAPQPGGRRSCHIARTPGQSLVVSDSALSATSISGFDAARIQLHTRSSGKHLALNQGIFGYPNRYAHCP